MIPLHHGNRREIETLPSGKQVWRFINASGQLVSERHLYADQMGNEIICLEMRFGTGGGKVAETYLGRVLVEGRGLTRRYVERDTYERQRQEYPDMPPADPLVVDESARILEKSEREKRARADSAKRLGLNPGRLTELDLFCASLMEKGRRADAVEWIQSEGRTLGVMDETASRQLIASLTKLGARAVHACEIRSRPDGEENTGHLVVELPNAEAARRSLLRKIAGLARKQGLKGDRDVGQRYAYVKLD